MLPHDFYESPSRILSDKSVLKLGRVLKLRLDVGDDVPTFVRVLLVKRIKGGYRGWLISGQIELKTEGDELSIIYDPAHD